MKLAVLMDPLHRLKAYKDTTVGMLKRAEAMGWSCFYFTDADLLCRDGRAFANVYSISVGDVNQVNWADTLLIGEQPLSDFDIILMRKDPPFNLDYIYATYALELAEKEGVLVANKPQSLRDANEKYFSLHFPSCCPPTLVSKNMQTLRAFWLDHQDVIFKPLDGMGGSRVFRVTKDAFNLSVILETLTQQGSQCIMAQRYLPDIVDAGDKRILMVHGKPMAYGLARIPLPGELRGNLAAGAKGEVVAINERDRWLCQQLAPTLQAMGLYFVGIDVIGHFITEINVTSPTCAIEITEHTGLDLLGTYLEGLAKLKAARRP